MELQTTIDIHHHVSFAHRLKNDSGMCRNLHGHTWIITVKILGKVQKITGMIEDFGELKGAIKKQLDEEYDHATVLQSGDPYVEMIESDGGRLVRLDQPPTTEVLAARMLEGIQRILDVQFSNLKIIELGLQETPSNKVTVKTV